MTGEIIERKSKKMKTGMEMALKDHLPGRESAKRRKQLTTTVQNRYWLSRKRWAHESLEACKIVI